MTTKAELIERANHLRRNAESRRREDFDIFKSQVHDLRYDLKRVGVPIMDIEALLPSSLSVPPPPCRLTPLADHVVIRPKAPDAVSTGGILIPDSAQDVPESGEVLAIGPGRIEASVGTVLMTVQVGQQVLFGRFAGVKTMLDGDEVRIMREEDILGILAPEPS